MVTIIQAADRATVERIHGADVAQLVAERYPDALALLADGWTLDSALAHIEATCDRVLCTGEHCAACDRRPAGHGHFALFCAPCAELPYGVVAP